ncbi:MAG: hypothetical protein ACI4KI_06195 [Candidatus Fimenecus sp.]
MRVLLIGNFLNLHEGKDSNGNYFYSASVLSGDEVVRVRFDDFTKPQFDSLKVLDRMDECTINCETRLYKGVLYCNAVND